MLGRYGWRDFSFSYCGTNDFTDFLSVYSRIQSPSVELTIVDGPSERYRKKATTDWTLSIGSYKKVTNANESVTYSKSVGPLTAYIGGGGSVVWEDVHLPDGLRVVDLRKSSIADKMDREILDRIESLG